MAHLDAGILFLEINLVNNKQELIVLRLFVAIEDANELIGFKGTTQLKLYFEAGVDLEFLCIPKKIDLARRGLRKVNSISIRPFSDANSLNRERGDPFGKFPGGVSR